MQTYGVITNIVADDSVKLDGKHELIAVIETIVPSTKSFQTCKESIGFEPTDYKVGDYVYVKYYERDVNILTKISGKSVPKEIKLLLDSKCSIVQNDHFL